MRFAQIIEFTTHRIDDFNAHLDAWKIETDGRRIPHKALLHEDRDAQHRYVLRVEFASYDEAMENSSRPATSEFATFLADISEGPLTFRNLDLLRAENL